MKILSLITCLVLLLLPVAAAVQGEPFYPNDPYFFYDPDARPGFPGQWHLENQAPQPGMYQLQRNPADGSESFLLGLNAGIDANLIGAWDQGYTGAGVVIGIVDDGVEGSHPDIAPNYRSDLSRNFTETVPQSPQGPINADDNHGTAVAGVAAARGGNGIGGTGAAPYAWIAGLRHGDFNDEAVRQAFYWESGVNPGTGAIEAVAQIQVKNNSWNNVYPFFETASEQLTALTRTAANGVIHVFSAGNYRGGQNEDASKSKLVSNPDAISVAALGSDGTFASYSSYGSCVFVTAPSNTSGGFAITTTDRQGPDLGYNRYTESNPDGDKDEAFPDADYTSLFGGTSSAAPLVSGIMALGKEANPDMTVRMAKHALASTSRVVDPDDDSETSFGGWRTNEAGNHFNPNYGFGNIDAGGVVRTVHSTAYVTERVTYETGETPVNQAIPDNDPNGISRTFTLSAAELTQPLEGVEVYLDVTHTWRGDLEAGIASPSGMVSFFLSSTRYLVGGDNYSGDWTWTFLTNAFWGEDGLGEWTLNLADMGVADTGTWNSYNVTFYMGQMVLQTAGTMTQSADIRAESLTLTNPGTTFVNPSGRTFRVMGNVRLEAGTLVVNGQITEAPGSFGNLLSLNGGVVMGAGHITASRGFYNNGGTVCPGNSIGTLTIAGDYTHAVGAVLETEVGGGASDLLAVTGTADIQGGTLNIVPYGYATAGDYTFLTAGTLLGAFDQTDTPAVLNAALSSPIPNVLSMSITRNSYQSLAANWDQASLGGVLDLLRPSAVGDMAGLLNQIDTLSLGGFLSAMDDLMPKLHAGASAIALGNTRRSINHIRIRGRNLRSQRNQGTGQTSIGGPLLASADNWVPAVGLLEEPRNSSTAAEGPLTSGSDMWFTTLGSYARYGDTSESPAFREKAWGFMLGLEFRINDSLSAGVAGAFTKTRLDEASSQSSSENDSYKGLLYALWDDAAQDGGYYAESVLGFGQNRFDSERSIAFLDRTASSSHDGQDLFVSVNAGHDWTLNRWKFGPTMGIEYAYLHEEGYGEHGAGAADLTVDSSHSDSLLSLLGVHAARSFPVKRAVLITELRARWDHDYLADSESLRSRFTSAGPSFDISGRDGASDSLLLGASLKVSFGKNIAGYLDYDCMLQGSDGDRSHLFNAGLKIVFD